MISVHFHFLEFIVPRNFHFRFLQREFDDKRREVLIRIFSFFFLTDFSDFKFVYWQKIEGVEKSLRSLKRETLLGKKPWKVVWLKRSIIARMLMTLLTFGAQVAHSWKGNYRVSFKPRCACLAVLFFNYAQVKCVVKIANFTRIHKS